MGDNGPVCGAEFTLELAVFPSPEADDGWHGVLGGSADLERLDLGMQRAPSLYVRDTARLHGGYGDGKQWNNWDTDAVLLEGAWNHLALVCDGKEQRLFVNGQPAVTEPVNGPPLATPIRWIGRTDSRFHGMIDEVRVWSVARTVEQIQQGMTQRLTGSEPGLMGLWNFDDPENAGRDASPRAAHGRAEGSPRRVEGRVEFGRVIPPAVVFGKVTNDLGQPEPGVTVRALARFRELRRTVTDADGGYEFTLRGDTGRALVVVSKDEMESQGAPLELKEGQRVQQDFQIKLPASVAGRVLDTQDRAQADVIVELIASDGTGQRTVTGSDGAYALRRVVPGSYQLRAQAAGGFVMCQEGKEVVLEPGAKLTGADFRREQRGAEASRMDKANGVLRFGEGAEPLALPGGMLAGFEAATVECWVRWEELRQLGAAFGFGDEDRSIALEPLTVTADLAVVVHQGRGAAERLVAPGVLRPREWMHVALAMQGQEMTLYLNGVRVVDGRTFDPLKRFTAGGGLIGGTPWYPGDPILGEVDELRIWAVRRTPEQIMAMRDARLTGDEDGLLALYQCDDAAQPGRDSSPRGLHAAAPAEATAVAVVPETLPAAQSLPVPLVITGMVTDPDGRALPKAEVRIAADGAQPPPVLTDDTGVYLSTLPAAARTLTLSAASRELACPPRTLEVKPGENSVDLALRDSASISGRTLALDDSPLPNVVVQAVSVQGGGLRPGLWGEFTKQSNLTAFDEVRPNPVFRRVEERISFPLANHSIGGADMDTAFYVRWSGRLRVTAAGAHEFHLQANDRARLSIDGREIVEASSPLTGTTPLMNTEKSGAVELTAGDHDIVVEYLNRIGREDCELAWTPPGGTRAAIPASALWHEPSPDQLLSTTVSNARGSYRFPLLVPGDYQLRAHTADGMVPLYGGRTVTVKRGEPRDRTDFRLPSFKKGVWRRYSISDGLGSDVVNCIHAAPDGAMWLGTQGGATRYDGRDFSTLSETTGLANSNVYAVLDEGAAVWFGTMNGLTRWQPHGEPEF